MSIVGNPEATPSLVIVNSGGLGMKILPSLDHRDRIRGTVHHVRTR
jgi:hypothetical protein